VVKIPPQMYLSAENAIIKYVTCVLTFVRIAGSISVMDVITITNKNANR